MPATKPYPQVAESNDNKFPLGWSLRCGGSNIIYPGT